MAFLNTELFNYLSAPLWVAYCLLQLIAVVASEECLSGYYPFTNGTTVCAPCHAGSYSERGWPRCVNHTNCSALYNRLTLTPGTSMTNSKCGNCRMHFVSQEGDGSYMTMCIPCENASQEARDRYDYEWCHAMKPIEIYRRSHEEVIGISAALCVLFVSFSVAIACVVIYYHRRIKKMKEYGTSSPADDDGHDAERA